MIFLTTCKKQGSDDTPKQYPDHIVAGRAVGAEILYSGPLGIEIIYSGPGQYIEHSWAIDLNRDGTDDYLLEYIAHSSHGFADFAIEIKSLDHTNNHLAVTSNHITWVDTIPVGASIDDDLNWYQYWANCDIYDYFVDINNPPSVKGIWKGAKDKYIGLRMAGGENPLYGWIRIETDGTSFKLFDYACSRGY